MIRKIIKERLQTRKFDPIIHKYKLPKAYLAISRRSIANAFLVGLFFALVPMPFQMIAVLFCTPLLKFNVPVALSLVWITNPFTMPFIFYTEYLIGNTLLFREGINSVELTMSWFQNNLEAIFIPLYFGAFVSAVTTSLTGWYLVTRTWKHSVHQEKHHKKSKRNSAHPLRDPN